MQRDVDLARQLLLDLERRGADCPVAALRSNLGPDADERVRHHLRLLIDAGWVKEVDRDAGSAPLGQTAAAAGTPCVRLTDAGHEFIELARSDARWREAKTIVTERTGGPSLALVREVLARWAWQAVLRGARHRRRRLRRAARRYFEGLPSEAWLDAWGAELPPTWDDDQARFARRRTACDQRFDYPDAWPDDLYDDMANDFEEASTGATLPEPLI